MLFTTLVPIYKTHFLEDTVACLNAQSRQTFQVIFSDDSPTQDLAPLLDDLQITQRLRFPYRIIQGRRIGPATNCHDLFAAWAANKSTPYIHFLLDDDLIFPDFYLWHERAFARGQAKLCVSSRIIVNEKKTPFAHTRQPDFINEQNASFSPLHLPECLQTTLPTLDNWLGELSCATLDGAALGQTLKGQLHQLPYYGINDLGLFLEMIAAHPACYINNTLGAFRVNRWQTSRDAQSSIFKSTIISWASLALDAYHMGQLSEHDVNLCLARVQHSVQNLLPTNPDLHTLALIFTHLPQIPIVAAEFKAYWPQALAGNADFLHAHLAV